MHNPAVRPPIRGKLIRYFKGSGVASDYVESYAYFNLAAGASSEAVEVRDNLEKQLSREDVAAGQRRTRELLKELEARRAFSQPPR